MTITDFIIAFIILTLLTSSRRAYIAAILVFWAPYIFYLRSIGMVYTKASEIARDRVSTRRYGYIFKLCLKVLKTILNMKEVDEIMKGVRYDKPHEYICEDDRQLANTKQTVFEVRYLTASEQAMLRDLMYKVAGVGAARKEQFLTGTMVLKALELGLLGWQNFKYEDSEEEIVFNQDNFSCIPPAIRDELANHIRGTEEGEA